MSLKSLIEKMDQISALNEATKETPTGRIHKAEPGGYGRKDDEDDEGKKVEPAVKRGRGRPKKGADSDTGEVKKYDFAKDLQSFMVGNLPGGKAPGKKGQVHKIKDESIEESSAAQQAAIAIAKKKKEGVAEGTKETSTGRVHKAEPGGYGRKDDEDSEGKKVQAQVKRGRGRPKKNADSDTGEVKKWDTDKLASWIVGNKPKTLPGKASVKHKLKDWMEHVEKTMVVESVLGEGRMKDMLWGEAERLSLEDFVDQHAHHPEDVEWVTSFWKTVHGEEELDEVALDPSQVAAPQIKAAGMQAPQGTTQQPMQAGQQKPVQPGQSQPTNQPQAGAAIIDFKNPQDPLKSAIQQAVKNKQVAVMATESKQINEGMASKLEDLLKNYPHEHKIAQEGWGLHEALYQALCDHYWNEGEIPREKMYGPAEELRNWVEECYMTDTQPVMGEGLEGAALGGIAGAALGKTPQAASLGANLGSGIQDTLTTEGDREEAEMQIKTPAFLRKERGDSPLSLSQVGTKDRYGVGDKTYAIGDETLARGTAAVTGKPLHTLPDNELEASLRGSVQGMEEDYMSESKLNKQGVAEGTAQLDYPTGQDLEEGPHGGDDYTLGNPVDKEYVYQVWRTANDVRDYENMGKWVHDGGTTHSLADAKRRKDALIKGTHGVKAKIVRVPRSQFKLAGPQGHLPEEMGRRGVAEGSLVEMDKSAPQPGRDGRVSHSTYGSRDKGGSKGPEKEVKPITAKKAKQDALDILKKQGVAEGAQEDARFTPRPEFRQKIEDELYSKYLSSDKASWAYTGVDYFKHDGKVYVEVVYRNTKDDDLGRQRKRRFLVNKDFTLTPILIGGRTVGEGVAEGEVEDGQLKKELDEVVRLFGKTSFGGDRQRHDKTNPNRTPDQQEKAVAHRKATANMVKQLRQTPAGRRDLSYDGGSAVHSDDDPLNIGRTTSVVRYDVSPKYARYNEGVTEKEVEESGLQAYLGNKKYGKEGMDALRKAGREGASKEKMAQIRDKHDKLDEVAPEGWEGTVKAMKKHKDIDNPWALAHWMKGKGMKSHKKEGAGDAQMEAWNKQLNTLLTEGMTITTSTGNEGASDSVSISATDADAQTLMKLLQNSGLMKGQSSSMSTAPADDSGTNVAVEPVSADEVMGTLEPADDSGDDSLNFLKRMIGARSEHSGVDDSSCGGDYEQEDGEKKEVEEMGNEAASSGDSQMSPVPEDEMEEGNLFTGNLAKARAAGKKEADLDGDGDMEKVKEELKGGQKKLDVAEPKGKLTGADFSELRGKKDSDDEEDDKKEVDESALDQPATMESEKTCNECGMYESDCGGTHGEEKLDEWANSPNDSDEKFLADLTFMTKTISGGLNGMKQDQTVLPSTRVKTQGETKHADLTMAEMLRKLQNIN